MAQCPWPSGVTISCGISGNNKDHATGGGFLMLYCVCVLVIFAISFCGRCGQWGQGGGGVGGGGGGWVGMRRPVSGGHCTVSYEPEVGVLSVWGMYSYEGGIWTYFWPTWVELT